MQFDPAAQRLVGSAGSLPISPDDEVSRKLLMIFEGECEGSPLAVARKFGFSKQRYFQLRNAFKSQGSQALLSQKRGPKAPSKRTDQAVRQVIRQRFLDPDVSADVIAQKLRQAGFPISTRTVERVIADFGLQKKTL